MELPQDLPVGQDLVPALNLQDTVLTVAITANRSDCLSVLGLAREVAALLNQPLRHPEVQVASSRGPELKAKVTILDPVHCPRYAARLLTGLTVQASPFWLRRRLQLAGLRSINNLVDVTNYVLLEFGQPLHAFDFEKLGGGEIVVRLPRPGDHTFVTLDGQERQLDPETLLICDAARPVALAGIMGGLDSEVTAATSQVLIESAYFNPRTIRRTAKRLGLSTEASYRFERGVDPDAVTHALERATQLMLAVGGGEACGARLDAYPAPIQHPRLSLRVSRANQVLGTDFAAAASPAGGVRGAGQPGGAGALLPGGPGAGSGPHRGDRPAGRLWDHPGDPAPGSGVHPAAGSRGGAADRRQTVAVGPGVL
jgi:phenylalanyl-tRNA synthetase beta chain